MNAYSISANKYLKNRLYTNISTNMYDTMTVIRHCDVHMTPSTISYLILGSK